MLCHAKQRVCVKFLDLGVESVLLHRILEAGSPPALLSVFTAIVGSNALSCITMMFLPDHHSGLTEVLIDTLYVHSLSLSLYSPSSSLYL